MKARMFGSMALVALAACPSEGPPTTRDSSTPTPPAAAAPSGAPAVTQAAVGATAGTTPPAPKAASAQAAQADSGTSTFDSDKADAPPSGFSFGRTGSGAQGKWVIKADADAPSK